MLSYHAVIVMKLEALAGAKDALLQDTVVYRVPRNFLDLIPLPGRAKMEAFLGLVKGIAHWDYVVYSEQQQDGILTCYLIET